MNLRHYDVVSLAYLSTDIVIAQITEDSQHRFSATVVSSLYGPLHPGDRIDALTPFLGFFRPMENGFTVVLFLDRRPRQYDFLHSEATKSPYAIPPSGVYLIDAYQHVHEYHQQNNPGPYVADGYSYFPDKSVPTKEQDLALPSLEEMTARIAAAIQSVEPVRAILDGTATRDDIPTLMRLVDTAPVNRQDCRVRQASAITERALHQIRTLNDPELLLRAYSVAQAGKPDGWYLDFIQAIDQGNNGTFVAARIKYLLQVLADRKADNRMRVAATQILLTLSSFHVGPQTGPSKPFPIDNPQLAEFAGDIPSAALRIFEDASENAQLRALNVQFLDVRQQPLRAAIKHAYTTTRSDDLRYAIERWLLQAGSGAYQVLERRGPAVTAIVSVAQPAGCNTRAAVIVLVADYMEGDGFRHVHLPPHLVITNLRTRTRLTPSLKIAGGWYGAFEGHVQFELPTAALAAGTYSVAVEFNDAGRNVETGYAPILSIARDGTAKVEVSR